ncbi:glutaredoxin family protein [Halovenus sp. HT40]|uniref:glutaredoxin family protein n=1 Tax=Halovenus sp. HT40 TaxID=3126691 RepID=UPI00300F71F7
MQYRPQSDLTAPEAAERVETVLTEHDVVLFMKGSKASPQCEYSRRALQLLTERREEVQTVNVLDALEEYRAALAEQSGWETIPQAYVDGEFIGGSDVLDTLAERGELEARLD